MPDNEVDPEVERKAQRALRILYFAMAVGILLPFALWWFRRG